MFPTYIPTEPTPQMMRPMISAVMLGAAPQTTEPISKIATPKMNSSLLSKEAKSLALHASRQL